MKFLQTDWDKYRIFHFVAKNGTLTQAAKALETTQPSLSRNIMDLESKLGRKLFKRSVRGMVLTEQGQELSQIVNQIFGELTRFEERMHSTQSLPKGILHLAVPSVLPGLWVSQYDQDFKDKFPQLYLSLVEKDSQIDLITSSIEAQISVFKSNADELEQIPLTTCTMGLYATQAYIDQKGSPRTKEDLANHAVIGYSTHIQIPGWDVNWHLSLSNQKIQPLLQVNSASSMIQAVEAGFGIAMLPVEYAAECSHLIRILPEIQSANLELYYSYPQYHKSSQKILSYQLYLEESWKKSDAATPSSETH